MISSLPMFDLPEVRTETDALWATWSSELRAVGVDAPSELGRPDGVLVDHWRSARLCVSQTCGFPFASSLHDRVSFVATWDVDVAGMGGQHERPGWYRSLLVAREGDPTDVATYDGSRVAINHRDSLSGCVSLGVALLDAGVRAVRPVDSGAHVVSLAMLRDGTVDLAAIDSLTFALLGDHRSETLVGLQIVGLGPRIPTPPLIAGPLVEAGLARAALDGAIVRLRADDPAVLQRLRVRGVSDVRSHDYLPTRALAERAATIVPVDLGLD